MPTPHDADTSAHPGSTLRVVLTTTTLALIFFGDVLAFNQLATQSATDAILQTLVFSIGAAGVFEFLRRVLVPDPLGERRTAIVPAALSIAALFVWRAQTPVGWAVLVTGGAAVALGLWSLRAFRETDDDRGGELSQLLGLLGLAQTIVFLYIAALALADGRPNLFS